MNEANHLLHQPAPSRPVTNYLDMPIPTTASHDGFDMGGLTSGGSGHGHGGLPSAAEIENAVQNVLRTADLNTVTKREIRRQLEDEFGMDLSSRKTAINAAIDRILLG
jgi:chitin synthase